MPIYEYKCKKCGIVFEVIQKFSDALIKKCEECGGPVEKLISMSSFHLKGTGWYKTDYASKPKPKSEVDADAKPKDSDKGGKADCSGCPSAS